MRRNNKNEIENGMNAEAKRSPVLYTVNDVMEIFGIGRTKAYQLMVSSGFPSIRLNKKLLVSKDKLEEWIQQNSGRTYNY